MEFWEIYFLTKFVPEAIKISLHTSSAPFWNGISVSNLLILSNLLFFGLYLHSYAKHLCTYFWIRLYIQLTAGPGLNGTEFLSENSGFWPNLVQMVCITLKVTTTSNDPKRIPLGATRGTQFFTMRKLKCLN